MATRKDLASTSEIDLKTPSSLPPPAPTPSGHTQKQPRPPASNQPATRSTNTLHSTSDLHPTSSTPSLHHPKQPSRASSTVGSVSDLGGSQNQQQHRKVYGSRSLSTTGSLGSLGGSLGNLGKRRELGGGVSHRNVWFGSVGSVGEGGPGVSSASTLGGKKKFGSNGSLREPTLHGMLKFKFCRREEAEVYATKFSLDEDYVAAGLGDSRIQIYSTRSGELAQTLCPPPLSGSDVLPCTSIAFRPDNSSYRNRNVLLAGYADGRTIHWHVTSGQMMSTVQDGADAQVNCVTYSPGGGKFATASSDCTVRVFDGVSMQCEAAMSTGREGYTAGHSSKVFSVKFHPNDPNILVSGGWDNTLQMWDLRVGHSIRSIYGPHICGDSLDIDDTGERILTGSYARENQLQIWSFSKSQLIESISWSVMEGDRKSSFVYSAAFSKGKGGGNKYVLAGGAQGNANGLNEVKMFGMGSGKRAVGMAQGFSHSVYTTHMSSGEHMVAVGGGFRALYVYDVDPHQTTEFLF
ncbi:hypothetical protein HDU97_004609 [Phlyctochytrium planicorne]|nr:hypothetical protein HDU97_004609 [Phlyctochytrium planicorne]